MLTLAMLGLLSVLGRDPAPASQPAPGGAKRARPTPPTSQPAEPRTNLRQLLAARVEEVDWENVTFENALAELRGASHINIAVRWRVLEERGVVRTVPVTLHLRGVTVAALVTELLHQVSPEPELRYVGVGNILTISTLEDLNSTMYVKVYPIDDLIHDVPDFIGEGFLGCVGGGGSGARSAGDRGSGGYSEISRTRADHLSEVIDLIQSSIEPNIWEVNGGRATIRVFLGRSLVVRAPLSVHEKLGGPLILDER